MIENGEGCSHYRFSSIRVKICNVKEPKRKNIEVKVQCMMCYSKFPTTQEVITKLYQNINF